MARPLKISKAQAVLTITATTATTNIVTVSQNLTTAGVIRGMPFIPATTVGGLTGGTTYYVLTVLSDTTFLASATSVDANATYTPVTLSTTTGQSVSATVGLVNSGYNNPAGAGNTYGVVGGNTALYGNQVVANIAIGVNGAGTITASTEDANLLGVGTDFANTLTDGTIVYTVEGSILGTIDDIANANAVFATFAANATANVSGISFVHATPEAGYIVRQKGKTKYLVTGLTSGLTAQCFTANVANTALTPNTMVILGTYANTDPVNVKTVNNYNSEVFYDTNNATANPDFTATFGTAEAANVDAGIRNPIITINKA